MFRSGEFVAQHINGGELDEKQIQPNGVDLTIGKLEKLKGKAYLTDSGYIKNERVEVPINSSKQLQHDNAGSKTEIGESYPVRRLTPYVITYGETIEIPDGHVGFVYPRSRINRCGAHITTAVWDSGYRGKGEGCLLSLAEMDLATDMRVAQIVFAETEQLNQSYDGQHQNENLESFTGQT